MQDRTLTCAFFTPSESQAEPSALFSTGPYQFHQGSFAGIVHGDMFTNLYRHPYGPDVAPAPGLAGLQPAMDNVSPIAMGVVGHSPDTDSLGRLFLTTVPSQTVPEPGSAPYLGRTSSYWITRYDPRTGVVGPELRDRVLFSPSRARGFAGDSSQGTLFDLEASRDLPGVTNPVFVGEDFYYLAVAPSTKPGPPSGAILTRIKPNAEPEVLLSSSGGLSVTLVQGGPTPQMVVRQYPATSAMPGLFMLDLDTLARTPLPSDLANSSLMSASPSGRWLLFSTTVQLSGGDDLPTQTLTLVDFATGARTDLVPPLVGATAPGFWSSPVWRPGHDELWIQTDDGTFKVTEPGDLVTKVSMDPGLAVATLQAAGTDWVSGFTRDGQYWFSGASDYSGPVYMASVDDPTFPPVQINPQGTWPKPYWETGDGPFLVGAAVEDDGRQELYFVDPAAGTVRALASAGQVVGLGKTRALALLAWDGGRSSGALTLIDLATGAQTVLADDVYLVAVDPGHFAQVPPDHDMLGPGTEIAFLSRGRFASSYDGLWVTQLP